MQVRLAAAQVDLEVGEAAQAVADRRDAAIEHRRVGDHHDVGLEQVLVALDEVVEVGAADFLFALDQELHVHRQVAVLLQVRFDRLEVHEHLALVVGRAARVDLAVADRRLERRRGPQVHRVHRLHVVVAVEQDRRRARRRRATRRRRRDGPAFPRAARSAARCAASRRAVHSAHLRTSPLCSGSALMLGMARYCFISSM